MTELSEANAPARLSTPRLSARVSAEESASVLARLIASGTARTRAELVRETGLARSTVSTGLEALQSIGLLDVGGLQPTVGRGRPGEVLRIAPAFGAIAVVELDVGGASVGLYDFGQRLLARTALAASLTDPPDEAVASIGRAVEAELGRLERRLPLRTLVISAAAPVDVRRGLVVGPPFLASWDGFPLGPALSDLLGCVVIVRNETDLRALGEARHLDGDSSPLLYLRISQGVGSGYIDASSELVSGVDGAAGEISHLRALGSQRRRCTCGGFDHLASYASEAAMLDDWRAGAASREDDSMEDFESALRVRDPAATEIAIAAARELGAAIAEMLLILNPARVCLAGRILDASDAVMATVRAVVYETGLPLATRNLQISRSRVGEDAGLLGGLVIALEQSLSAGQVGEHLARGARGAAQRP